MGVSELSQGEILRLRPKVPINLIIAHHSGISGSCYCCHLVAAMRFTSRNHVFTQLVIKTFLSNLKIGFTDCIAIAVPVNLKVWPPS
jgi:hypothetical protein